MVTSDMLVVSITALGDLEGRAPVTRSGALPGDVLAVCGKLGWSAAGLAVLGRGFRSPVTVVGAPRAPEPPYAAGAQAARAGATAMLDTIGFSGFNTALQALECDLPVDRRARIPA